MSLPHWFYINPKIKGPVGPFPDLTSFNVQFNSTQTGRNPPANSLLRSGIDVIQGPAASEWADTPAIYSSYLGYSCFYPLRTGTYRITARGPSQENRGGGDGALIRGDFYLSYDTPLEILIGQRGDPYNSSTGAAAGGTFVVKKRAIRSDYINDDILVIAGGGGGAHNMGNNSDTNGQAGTEGGHAYSGGSGGTNGGAGGNGSGQSGAGFFISPNYGPGTDPQSFIHGGLGGTNNNSNGGFGGGGGHGGTHGGGAGGYSGGGGSSNNPYAGGGGGSYNNGTNQVNTAGGNSGYGSVRIQLLST